MMNLLYKIMKRHIDNHLELGPWKFDKNINAQSIIFSSRNQKTQSPNSQQIPELYCNRKNKQIILPKMPVRKFEANKTKNHYKTKSNFVMNIKPLKLEVTNEKSLFDELQQARKSKTLSFEPPLISFYNKNHPKVTNKRYHKYILEEPNLVKSQRMSKIDLSYEQKKRTQQSVQDGTGRNSQLSVKKGKTSEYEFAKKRSIMEVLRYLKNCEEKRSINHQSTQGTSNLNKIYRYQQLQEMNNSKFESYIPLSNKHLTQRRS